ncbi:hypothetical protein VNI00_010187 [Paramarasmius palmivorus]|uniref:Uncharacterized protein n=1 Tax=Paramarasmius palmivorus TaxID=297713 RepID=A0AAW0CJH3_9AGAR
MHLPLRPLRPLCARRVLLPPELYLNILEVTIDSCRDQNDRALFVLLIHPSLTPSLYHVLYKDIFINRSTALVKLAWCLLETEHASLIQHLSVSINVLPPVVEASLVNLLDCVRRSVVTLTLPNIYSPKTATLLGTIAFPLLESLNAPHYYVLPNLRPVPTSGRHWESLRRLFVDIDLSSHLESAGSRCFQCLHGLKEVAMSLTTSSWSSGRAMSDLSCIFLPDSLDLVAVVVSSNSSPLRLMNFDLWLFHPRVVFVQPNNGDPRDVGPQHEGWDVLVYPSAVLQLDEDRWQGIRVFVEDRDHHDRFFLRGNRLFQSKIYPV